MDPRQSQQLLNTLTASFQTHLDQIHPPHSSAKSAQDYASDRVSSGSSRERTSTSSFLRTNDHFNSIITHPVLARQLGQSSQPNASLNADFDKWSRSTFDLIQDHLAKGTLTISNLSFLLRALENVLPSVGNPKDINGVELASKILSWIVASNQISLHAILSHAQCRHSLITLLVWENRTDVIRNWIDNSAEELVTLRPQIFRTFVNEMLHERGLATAVRELISAPTDKGVMNTLYDVLDFMVHHPLAVQEIDASLYDRLVAEFKPSLSGAGFRGLAVLALMHPTRPSPDAALAYITVLSSSADSKQWILRTLRRRNSTVAFCLQLSKLLMHEERHTDAEYVLQFVQETFPRELGLDPVKPKSKAAKSAATRSGQASILQQLDGLLAT
jgi:hypothetical protein